MVASAEPWVEDKVFFPDAGQLGSSMVDAADLDGDGWIDLVFANGEGYDKGTPDSDQLQQAFHNDAGMGMLPIGPEIFQGVTYAGRAVKIRDVDNDGDLDMVLADWGADSPVSDINSSGGVTQLWTQMGEPGYGGEGTAMFDDNTLGQMPNIGIRWSWDLEFVDLDNDYDLDVVVSCFACTKASVYLFANDGSGNFSDIGLASVPQGVGALNVEAMDLNGDAFLDLVTLHDATGGRNRVLIANKQGAFEDKSSQVWPMLENPSSYDTMVAFLDYNSASGPDMIVGALQPGDNKYPERLMENQNGKFKANNFAFAETKPSPGTYAIVLADFNLDRILDVAMAQNENASEKKVFIGSPVELQPDSAAPVFVNHQSLADDIEFGIDHTLRVRVHDNKSPLMLHDFRMEDGMQDGRPYVESWTEDPNPDPDANPGTISDPGQWYGEYLWRITFNVPADIQTFWYRKCAIDAAGNKYCTGLESVDNPDFDATTGTESITDSGLTTSDNTTSDNTSGTGAISITGDDTTTNVTLPTTSDSDMTLTNPSTGDTLGGTDSASQLDDDGCGCDTDQSPAQGILSSLALLGLLGLRRRRTA